jgi:hypothetical protein
MRERPGYRPAVSGSNRGFWKVVVPLGVGGILLVVLVLVFRPVARTGAVAYAQANLRRAAEAAEHLAMAGSLADADRETLAVEGGVDDLLLIDPDQSSNDPEVVSVLATGGAWTGSARAETGECFWIRVAASGGTVVGTGTDCSADEASAAPPGTWPEP